MPRFGPVVLPSLIVALLSVALPRDVAAQARAVDALHAPQTIATAPGAYSVALPWSPFGVVVTHDQEWAFVSFAGRRAGRPPGMAVLRRTQGRYALAHVVSAPAPTTGLVLTHDGRHLIAAANGSVLLLDVKRLIDGERDPLVSQITYDKAAGSVYVNVTADDRTLFVSDERAAKITVIDLARVRAHGFTPEAVLGRIAVGLAPIALTFSADGRWLYTTSERAPDSWGWPKTVRRESARGGTAAPLVAEGAVLVLDVERARTNPARAVVARVPAGGSPVRLALSPAGDRVYVTARNDHALRIFDAAALVRGEKSALLATVPVGHNPVPVLALADGRTVLVGNSNRFGAAPDAASTLTVIAADRIDEGPRAVRGTIAAGAFPREFHLTADGRTVLLTNFSSQSVLVFDAAQLASMSFETSDAK